MKTYYYTIHGRRLRVRTTGRRPACKRIGDAAWQIGNAVLIAVGDRLEQL